MLRRKVTGSMAWPGTKCVQGRGGMFRRKGGNSRTERHFPDYYQIVGAEQSAWEEDIRVDIPIIVTAGVELIENG